MLLGLGSMGGLWRCVRSGTAPAREHYTGPLAGPDKRGRRQAEQPGDSAQGLALRDQLKRPGGQGGLCAAHAAALNQQPWS
jgi:hypothetical protein